MPDRQLTEFQRIGRIADAQKIAEEVGEVEADFYAPLLAYTLTMLTDRESEEIKREVLDAYRFLQGRDDA